MSESLPIHNPNHENWLNDVAGRLQPSFTQLGASLPERLRLAICFPYIAQRAKTTGEHWYKTTSADGTFEILIRPELTEADSADAVSVAAAPAREVVHAAVGIITSSG